MSNWLAICRLIADCSDIAPTEDYRGLQQGGCSVFIAKNVAISENHTATGIWAHYFEILSYSFSQRCYSSKKLTLVVNNTTLWQLQRLKNARIFALKCLFWHFFLVIGFALIRGRKNVIPPPCQVNCNGINHSPEAAEEGKANNIRHQKWIFCLGCWDFKSI